MSTAYRLVESYHRQKIFDFWSEYENPFYSATFHLDIRRLKAYCAAQGYPLYLNLCYFMIRAMRGIEDFRGSYEEYVERCGETVTSRSGFLKACTSNCCVNVRPSRSAAGWPGSPA